MAKAAGLGRLSRADTRAGWVASQKARGLPTGGEPLELTPWPPRKTKLRTKQKPRRRPPLVLRGQLSLWATVGAWVVCSIMANDLPENEQELTDKRARFIDEYLIDCNATKAAIRAGYAKSGARVEGHRLLTNANIRAAIDARLGRVGNERQRSG